MKLHLPKPLRNSVLACIAAVAGIATPTLGTATFAGGVVAFTLASQQAQAAEIEYNSSSNNSSVLSNASATDTIVIAMDSGYFTAACTVEAKVRIDQAVFTDGYSNNVYTFNNTVTGTGRFSYQPTTGCNNNKYVFNGDVSGYSGDMNIAANKSAQLTFNNKSGTGAITAGGGTVNANGATMNNSSIQTTNLNVSGASSFVGSITSVNTSIAAGSTVSLQGATNALGALTLNVSALTTSSAAMINAGSNSVTASSVTMTGWEELAGSYSLIQTTNDAAETLITLLDSSLGSRVSLTNTNGLVKMMVLEGATYIRDTQNIPSNTEAGKGYEIVSGGTLKINNGDGGSAGNLGAGATVNVGDIKVNEEGALHIWAWTSSEKVLNNPTSRVNIDSDINLAGGKLTIDDGSYNFKSIAVSADSEFVVSWGKGIDIAVLSGEGDLDFSTPVINGQEGYLAVQLTGENASYTGDVTFTGGIQNGCYLVLSHERALDESVVTLGGDRSKLALNAESVILKGIGGSGSVELCTLAGNAGVTSSTLTLNVAEDVSSELMLGAGINVVKNGVGIQSIASFASDANRSVVVNAGVFEVLGLNDVKSIQIAEGAVLRTGMLLSETKTWGTNAAGSYTLASVHIDQNRVTGAGTLEIMPLLYASGTASVTDSSALVTLVSDDVNLETLDVRGGWVGIFDASNPNSVSAFMQKVQTVKLDGAGILAAGGSFVSSDAAYTTNFDIVVGEKGGYLRVFGDANDSVTYNGALIGSGTLYKTDGGKVVLNGDLSGFGGTLAVTNGILQIGGAGLNSAVSLSNNTQIVFTEDATLSSINIGDSTINVANGAHVTIVSTDPHSMNAISPKIQFSDNSVLTDNARMRLTNATMRLQGEGTYELDALVLSADGNNVGNVEIGVGSTLHITGTSLNTAGDAGSLLLSNWSAANIVNIQGTLATEVGMSNRDGTATVNVKNGGVLQFNGAMEGIDNGGNANAVTINVETGGTIKVGGSTNRTADGCYVVNLADATSVIATRRGATVAMNLNVAENATAVLSSNYTDTSFRSTLDGAGTYEKKGSGIITLSSVTNLKITEGMVKAASGGLNISGALTMNGGSFYYEGRTSGESTVVDLVTAASYNGNLSLAVSDLAAGKYDLFQGAAGLSANQVILDAQLVRGKNATLSVTNGLVSVTVTGEAGAAVDLEWNTDSPENTWAYGSTNWKDSGVFYTNDNVTFAGTGEAVTVNSDIKAGAINVTGDDYVLSGTGTVSASSLTVAAGKTFSLNTAKGNALGDVTLGDGATFNLGVYSNTDLGGAIGSGSLNLEGAANINVTAGDFTWGRTVSGENAKLTLIVSNGANVKVTNASLNNAAIKADGGTVAFGANVSLSKDLTITNSGKMTMTNGDTFNWRNTTEQNVLIDGGTLDLVASRQSFNQHVKMTLNNATILGTGQIDGQDNLGSLDFFETNTITATGVNLIEASVRLREGDGLTFDVQNGTTTVREIHGYAKVNNARRVTKSGAGELVLDGTNRAGSLTITNGTVALDKTATLGAGAVSMAAAEGASTPTLVFRGRETKSMNNTITGAGRIVQAGEGSTTLTNLSADWTGTVAIQKGTLSTGDSLAIGATRTLEVSSGTTLDSALTLAGGSLVLGSTTQLWDADKGMSLGGHALTLDSTNKTQLTLHLAEADKAMNSVITLFTNTSITLNEEDTLGTYFSGVISELSHAVLSVVDGSLIATIVPENKLEWAPGTDSVWTEGGTIGKGTYESADNPKLLFGAVTDAAVVTVMGEVVAKEVVITPGAGSVYEFDSATDADKITSADIFLESGTLALAAGVLGDDVTISMLDGTTLQWGTTAEASSDEDYSDKLTVNGNVTLDAGTGNNVTLSNDISGLTADSTTTLKGNFTLNDDTVLQGTVNIDGGTVTLLGLDDNQDDYNQNFTGSGSLAIDGGDKVQLTGTNNYTGDTVLNSGCVLQIDALSAYSAASTMTGAGELKLNAAGEYAWNHESDMTGTVTIASGATVKVTQALSTALAGAGAVNIGGTADVPIAWNSTGKSYTGLTTITTGSHVTTTAGLAGGGSVGRVMLQEGATLTLFDGEGLINSEGVLTWSVGHAIKGDGTFIIQTGKKMTNATSKLFASNDTLASLVLRGDGTSLEFAGGTQNGAFNVARSVTVEDGTSLIYNMDMGSMTNTIYLNGDGTGAADSGAMVFATTAGTDTSVSKEVKTNSSVVLSSDSSIYVGSHTHESTTVNNKGVLNGAVTLNGHTLTKTGAGTLTVYLDKLVATGGDKIDVDSGTLLLNCSANKLDAYSICALDIADGASVEFCVYDDRVLTLESGLTVDGTATLNSALASTTDIASVVTGAADSTILLAKGTGATMSVSTEQTYAGTWQVGNGVADGNWSLKASHADALKSATVKLNDSDAKLVLGVDTANLAKLTGTAGIVTGSGKTLNIANSEITGVQYSGAIGEGVTIQVSDGYQKITGADRTGNVTLATLRSVEDASEEPGYDDLGGGALLLSEGEESAPVSYPVLDLEGYTHSTAVDAGVTTILAGNKGSIQNLVLGQNMLLTTQVADAVVSNPSLANIRADLTLNGGKVKFHLNGSTAPEGEAFNAEVMTQYDLAGNNLVLREGTETALTFVPEAESGKLTPRAYMLFTNVGNLEDLADDWKETSDDTIHTSATLATFFKTNFSENGRTSYKFAKEVWSPDVKHLILLVEGGAADLVWNEDSGTWDTGTPDAEGKKSWMNGSAEDYFMDDDNVVFNAQKGADAYTITIDDKDGVRIGSMKVTGDAEYLFTGNAITSGEGLGNVHIGTAEAAYTGTVTFKDANSWKGNTNINSGAVVAKNASALSNTTVNLNGGSLTVDGVAMAATEDGVALHATVKMLGGVLNTTSAEGGAVTVKADLSAAGKNMSVNAATGTNLNLTLVGTEEVDGIIGGNVTINGEVVQEGNPVTGSVALGDATVVSGGSLNVAAGDVTADALVLQDAKEVPEGDTTTEIAAGAVTVAGGSLSAASLANAGRVTVDGASMSITGAVENDGILEVTDGSLSMGSLDNDGTLTIGGTKMKDVQLGETTVSVPVSSVVVNGDLDNENGTIIIGSAATETEDATYGSLKVTGHLTGTGAKEKLVVEAGSYLNVEGNLSAMENVELGIGGTVTVGGNVDISTLIVAKDALLHATGAETGTSSVEIGVLGGAGTVQVDNGTLHIGALKGFTGTLAGNGTLSTDNAQFLLETKQDTTTNITGGSVLVTEAANGSSVGLVTTNEIIINTMTTDAPSLSMTGVALKDVDTVDKLSITLTQMGTTAGVDGIIQAVDAADGGIDYHLLSIDGKQSLDLFQLTEDEAVHQYLLQKGYAHSDLLSAATFAAASSTDVYISFWKQSSEESTWNVGETETEAGLIVLQDGKLLSNDVLDNVQNVVVSGTKSIDLTAAGVNDVVLNKLVGTSTSKLTIAGDGKAGDSVSIGKSSYNGTLVLDGVAANFDLTGATVVGADKDTTLSGKLTNGTLSVQQSSTAQGAGLELKDSKVQVVIGKDFTKLTKNELDQMGGVIAKLGDVTTTGSSEVAVGTTSKGIFTDSVGYDKYFDMSSARVEGGKVVADRNTVYYTSKLADKGTSDNGKAGLAMADEALLSANPQGASSTGDLAAVLDQLDTMVATGNKAGADELGASLAGASTAVLGMAAMGDVDRQLRAIRNRTTTMGVDQSVVNADMPYFNAWINAEGDSREMGDDGTLGGYKLNSYGGTVGFDVDIEPTLTAGMALTAMYGDLDATGTDKATGNLDSYYVSAFARYCGSAWTHTFVGTIGMGDISLDRTVNGAQVKGETDSMSFGLMYEVGRVYAMDEDGTTCLQPVFNVTWKHTTVDAYTEKGGDVALSVDEQSLNTITFGLGARLQAVVGESMYNRTSIFECRLLAKADAGDTEGTSKVALGSSATHEVKSNEMGAIGIEVGAGLTIPLGDEGSSIFMDASAEIRADYTDVNGTVGYRVNF